MVQFRKLKKWEIKNKPLADLLNVTDYERLNDVTWDVGIDLRSLERYIFEDVIPKFESLVNIFRAFIEESVYFVDVKEKFKLIDELFDYWGIRNKALVKGIIKMGLSVEEFCDLIETNPTQVRKWIFQDITPRTSIMIVVLREINDDELYKHWKVTNVELAKEIVNMGIPFDKFCKHIDRNPTKVRQWLMGAMPSISSKAKISKLINIVVVDLFNVNRIEERKNGVW